MPKLKERKEDRIQDMVNTGMQAELEAGGLDMVVSVLKDGDGKQCTTQELQEIENKLVLRWRLKDKVSEKQIKAWLKKYRQNMGLPFETKGERQRRITLEEVRKWVKSVQGQFHIQDVYNWMPELAKSPPDRRQISSHLARLVKEGLIDRNGRYGIFRKVDDELEVMDFLDADESPVDIWLPFDLTGMVEIMPGNIVCIAGEKETGKTTMAMNIAWVNRNQWDVHYFNSEMGKSELKKRIRKFKDTEPYQWAEKISFYNRADNFQDVVKIGPDKLNIIDFMEVAGDNYPFVAAWIMEIHKKIIENGAIVIVCLEKPEGRDTGVGGRGTLDKPRLYLAVSRDKGVGKVKIVTGKNWATEENPRDKVCDFKVVQGAQLIQTSGWERQDKWNL